jgi:hypothetical protein
MIILVSLQEIIVQLKSLVLNKANEVSGNMILRETSRTSAFLEIKQDTVKLGNDETSELLGSEFSFHTHPAQSYIKYKVCLTFPSKHDYLNILDIFLELNHNTQTNNSFNRYSSVVGAAIGSVFNSSIIGAFIGTMLQEQRVKGVLHLVATAEGIYIITMNKKWSDPDTVNKHRNRLKRIIEKNHKIDYPRYNFESDFSIGAESDVSDPAEIQRSQSLIDQFEQVVTSCAVNDSSNTSITNYLETINKYEIFMVSFMYWESKELIELKFE